MDLYEAIEIRRSVRSFSEEMPPLEVVEKIINKARLAPTWANMQGAEYIIVRDNLMVKNIWEAVGQGNKFRSAPMFIVGIIGEKGSGKNFKSGLRYFMLDMGICFDHLILAATAEGLATCWIGHFDEDKMKELLEIPNKYRVVCLTPLGYKKKEHDPTPRKELEKITHYERYAGRK